MLVRMQPVDIPNRFYGALLIHGCGTSRLQHQCYSAADGCAELYVRKFIYKPEVQICSSQY